MTLMIRYVAKSDVGLIREGNEDSGYAGPRLLAVADGMGGHAAGELASSVAIEELVQAEERHKSGTNTLKALDSALHAAHKRIRRLVDEDPGREGMGTTVTALLWTGDQFGLAHIGDSRGYRLRGGELAQITTDHTFVQSLVDEGRITEDEASVHPARSMILKALQGDVEPQVDLEMLDVQPGDRYLLCSDGITDFVSTDTIRHALNDNADLASAAGALVQLALRAGAPDNVTLVLADVIDTDRPPRADDTAEVYLVGAASDDPPPPPPAARHRPGSDATRPLVAESGGVGTLTDDTSSTERVADPDSADGDPEELRYAPRPPRRWRWLRWLAVVVILVGLAWGGIAIASDWIRGQYFVGEQGGEVAIYRGINQDVGPLALYEYIGKPAELPVGALPEVYRNRVAATIAADSLAEAEDIVADLLGRACDAQPEPPTVLQGTEPSEDTGTDDGTNSSNGTDGSGDQADPPDDSDAAGTDDTSTATVTQTTDVDPDTQVNQPAEQPQTSGYPGLVCPEDQ